MFTNSKLAIAAALVLASVSGAAAQSYDPSVGSGNIAPQATLGEVHQGALAAYAQERGSVVRDTVHGKQPFTAEEKALFDRIRPW